MFWTLIEICGRRSVHLVADFKSEKKYPVWKASKNVSFFYNSHLNWRNWTFLYVASFVLIHFCMRSETAICRNGLQYLPKCKESILKPVVWLGRGDKLPRGYSHFCFAVSTLWKLQSFWNYYLLNVSGVTYLFGHGLVECLISETFRGWLMVKTLKVIILTYYIVVYIM